MEAGMATSMTKLANERRIEAQRIVGQRSEVSQPVRTNELQIWSVVEHLVDTPRVRARSRTDAAP
jgi:hypothetical protein